MERSPPRRSTRKSLPLSPRSQNNENRIPVDTASGQPKISRTLSLSPDLSQNTIQSLFNAANRPSLESQTEKIQQLQSKLERSEHTIRNLNDLLASTRKENSDDHLGHQVSKLLAKLSLSESKVYQLHESIDEQNQKNSKLEVALFEKNEVLAATSEKLTNAKNHIIELGNLKSVADKQYLSATKIILSAQSSAAKVQKELDQCKELDMCMCKELLDQRELDQMRAEAITASATAASAAAASARAEEKQRIDELESKTIVLEADNIRLVEIIDERSAELKQVYRMQATLRDEVQNKTDQVRAAEQALLEEQEEGSRMKERWAVRDEETKRREEEAKSSVSALQSTLTQAYEVKASLSMYLIRIYCIVYCIYNYQSPPTTHTHTYIHT